MRGAILPLPQYIFMACCSVKKAQGQLYFTFIIFSHIYIKIFLQFQWCLAVTNMDHVQLSVHSILCTFGVDKIITTDNETTCSTSENCRHTLKAVIDNTIESARNKIREAAVQKV